MGNKSLKFPGGPDGSENVLPGDKVRIRVGDSTFGNTIYKRDDAETPFEAAIEIEGMQDWPDGCFWVNHSPDISEPVTGYTKLCVWGLMWPKDHKPTGATHYRIEWARP